MVTTIQTTKDRERWIRNARRKYKGTTQSWIDLIKRQNGKCALTGAQLLFDVKNGTCKKGGSGCHPLYASVDHINPQRTDQGFQILCYDINDLKGHLPPLLFNALKQTKEWKRFIKKWRKLAKSQGGRKIFKKLIATGYFIKT